MDPSIDPAQLLEHTGWMKRLAQSLVGEDQAEDVVQQTWLAMLRSPPPRPATAVAWLATVVRRLAYRTRREERRRRRRERSVGRSEETFGSPDTALQRAELQRMLLDAVLQLDEPHRSTVVFRYFEELSVNGIAERQGVSANTVKTRLRRALAKLRDALDRAHGGERRAWIALLAPAAWRLDATPVAAAPRGVSTSAAEATRSSSPAVGIVAGGVAVSVKKVIVAVVVGALFVAGLGGAFLLDSPDRRGGENPASPIEPPSAPAVAESGTIGVTPEVAEVSRELESEPPLRDTRPRGSIRGRVRDRQGAAVAGIRVRAFRITKPHAFAEETALEGDTEASEVGEFEFAGLPIGTYIVRAISSKHRPAEVRDLELTADGELEVELEVQTGLATTGVVVDPHGRPVAGATVTTTRPPQNTDIGIPDLLQPVHDVVGWAIDELAVTTDEWGQFRITRLPSGNRRLVARHPDWATSDTVIASGSEGARIVMRLGATLRGRVVNSSNEPVAGARVVVARWLERVWHASFKTGAQVTTDDDGEFVFEHIAPGRFQLTSEVDGYLAFETGELEATEGASLEDVELVLEDAASASGVVEDATGRPVAGADVVASRERGGRGFARATTDDAGRFVLSPLGLGAEYHVRIEHPEFVTHRLESVLVDGEIELGTVTLNEGGVLSGEVVDTAGTLLPHVEVVLQRLRNETWSNGSSRRVDGVFELSGLDSGEYRVQASALGLAPVRSEPTSVDEGAVASVRLVLGDGAHLEGRVVDDRGVPVHGAVVRIRQGYNQVSAVSDATGRFLVRGLEKGEVLFEEARFRSLASTRPRKARTGDLLEVVLQRTARLSGTVRSQANGEPLTDFRVYLETRARRSAGSGIHFRNSRGRYVLDDLSPGTCSLRVTASDHVFHEIDVELASGEDRVLDIDLPRGQRVSGRLLDPSGEPVADAGIFPVDAEELGKPIERLKAYTMIRGMEGQLYYSKIEREWAQEVRSDAAGRFELNLAPGPVLLRVDYGESLFEDLSGFEVPVGRDLDLGEIRLRRAATVEGTVFNASGEPLFRGSLSLDLLLEDGTAEPRGTVYLQIDQDGRFRKTGLRPGTYRLRLYGHDDIEETVKLGVGETKRVELQLRGDVE